MKITDIRLRVNKNVEEDGKLKAYVDITFDESFVIHGLKIIEGQNGLFVAMPSRRMPNGEYKDIVHPEPGSNSSFNIYFHLLKSY